MVHRKPSLSLHHRGSQLVVHMACRIATRDIQHLTEACGDVSDVLISLSTASTVSLKRMKDVVAGVPEGMPVAFCSIPPSLIFRVGLEALAAVAPVHDH